MGKPEMTVIVPESVQKNPHHCSELLLVCALSFSSAIVHKLKGTEILLFEIELPIYLCEEFFVRSFELVFFSYLLKVVNKKRSLHFHVFNKQFNSTRGRVPVCLLFSLPIILIFFVFYL